MATHAITEITTRGPKKYSKRKLTIKTYIINQTSTNGMGTFKMGLTVYGIYIIPNKVYIPDEFL